METNKGSEVRPRDKEKEEGRKEEEYPIPLKHKSEFPKDQGGKDSRPWKEGRSGLVIIWHVGIPFLLTIHNLPIQNGGREHALI